MKRRGSAWPAALIVLSAIASALLATWLAGNLVERELRLASLSLNQARAAQLASVLDASLARLSRTMVAGNGAEHDAGYNGTGVVDRLLVDGDTLRVLQSTSPAQPGGQLLTSDAGRRAVQRAVRSMALPAQGPRDPGAGWQVDLNTRPVSAWLALPAALTGSRAESAAAEPAQSGALTDDPPGAEDLATGVRTIVLARVIPNRLLQADVFPGFNPDDMQLLTATDAEQGGVLRGAPVRLLEPSVRLDWRGASQHSPGVTAPVVGRALLGAALVALLLSAAWWRFGRSLPVQSGEETQSGRESRARVDGALTGLAAGLEPRVVAAEHASADMPVVLQRLDDEVTTVHDVVSLLAEELERLGATSAQATQVIVQSQAVSELAASHAGRVGIALDKSRNELRVSEKRVKAVAERAQEIGGLVSTISDLAERTGILALNASLQAAAAGPAGRQFASIAQEVKRLADSAAQAAVQVGDHVATIREETRLAADAASAASVGVAGLTRPVRDSQQAIVAMQADLGALAEQIGPLGDLADRNAEYQSRVNELVRSLGTLRPGMQQAVDANLQATREMAVAVRGLIAQLQATPADGTRR